MYIKSVILDGFKSYAKRTEISNFDPFFNAITGLNGSGKSNILDGICFLLGISNLSNVRANNLQELIYKSGQAGITKASVTIIFDNNNKKQSPIGYEDFEEITITRIITIGAQNKYLVNGCNSTHGRIHDLFCSIQMNVNNPHFLIMQGRITKVLNMKSIEILSMIEEATGTKMYETKRQLAFDTIAKKEHKINEINRMLNEDITPVITKLKEERSSYFEYQKITRELEHTKRICLAYDFMKLKEKKIKQNMTFEELSIEKKNLFQQETQLNFQLEHLDHEINQIQLEIDRKSGNEFQTKLNQLKEFTSLEIKNTSNYQHCVETLTNCKNEIKKIEEKIQTIILKIDENNEKKLNISNQLSKVTETKQKLDKDLEVASSLVQSATIGISDTEGKAQTITELLIASSSKIAKYKSDIDLIQKKIIQTKTQLKDSENELKTTCNENKAEEDQIQKLEKEIANKHVLKTLQTEITSLKRTIDIFESKNPSLIFKHALSNENGDPSNHQVCIHGVVSSLFSVMDERFNIAIESAAGGKLFNVVVNNDETTKKIIKIGGLKKRITFIALNRVSPYIISNKTIEQAKNIVGKDKVWSPLSLIEYDNYLKPAIEFVFGNTLICSSANEAKKLAYDKNVKCRCVTLDGDVFESTGTLTGGSRPTSNSLLQKQKELREMKKQLSILIENEKQNQSYIDKFNSIKESYKKITEALEEKQYELNLMKSKLKSSNNFHVQEKMSNFKNLIEEAYKEEKQINDLFNEETKYHQDLENKSKNEGDYKQEMLKKYQNNMNKIKNELKTMIQKSIDLEHQVHDLEFKCDELISEKSKLIEEQSNISSLIMSHTENALKFESIMKDTKNNLEICEKEVEELKIKMNECNQQMQQLNNQKTNINKLIFENQLKTKELNQSINNLKQLIQQTSVNIHDTLNNNNWLENEEKNFNSSGSVYNFSILNIKEVKDKLEWLEVSEKKLSRTINTRSMNLLSQAEEKYNDLVRKKKIVESDRKKIELIIHDLDIKKNEALKTSSIKVNSDFGSIFSTLLPGANAKLCPIENKNVLIGLEIKVGFGNVWKEGLSELSGGQRSLVALSLILSLLSFRPAPIYILDEIDAALDISHTQNIGVMLKSHFRQS
ncbi:hypothetical protein HZS_1498, partial [Henneguya salminicola]